MMGGSRLGVAATRLLTVTPMVANTAMNTGRPRAPVTMRVTVMPLVINRGTVRIRPMSMSHVAAMGRATGTSRVPVAMRVPVVTLGIVRAALLVGGVGVRLGWVIWNRV